MTTDPLIATADESVTPWAGIWIADDIEQIAHAVESGSWIDGTLGAVGIGLDGLALISDPLGGLLQYGIAWLIEHVKPLSETLDWLAGNPAQITANATTWRNTAASLHQDAATLRASLEADLPDWSGPAATAYATKATHQANLLETVATAATTTASITEVAGALVGAVRLMIRDAVATVVSRLIAYAAELAATLGVATPLVVEQVTTLCASWAAKIAGWLKSLITSLRRLLKSSARLTHNVDDLNGMQRTGGGDGPSRSPDEGGTPGPDGPPPEPEPPDFSTAEPDPRKITDYAMNPDHPVGKNKYRVIHSATGLDVGDAGSIEQQIREGVRSGTPILGKLDQHGQRWSVDVPLSGPTGTITVRTAWIVDAGATEPRMVTISFPK
ncbi:hypothetical protein GCM10010435_53040 [Winogradskya consettensis]|uniref:Bacterial CdiA-CT RNAse A domain-containing protein n=1 Tax=Winogradskya consettensis TaxID=113560 RepID=A0A919VMF8_9ACTN|nr:DUF6883 domain-containing protein [Actinoplanes consettensis]GIM71664.1 hypothetical protein Aco04nite_26400 [Actinoplanes consettensis]